MNQKHLFAAFLLLTLSACNDLEDPTSVKLEDIILLQITGPASLRADGVSTTTLKATLPAEATNRSIKFTTTRGSFLGTDGKLEVTATADSAGVAAVTLIAGRDVATANVTATIGTSTTSVALPQERAHADTLTAETTSAFATKNGVSKPLITALLARQTGQVSLGTPATFEAFRGGVLVGRFFNITTSDINGKATAMFAADTDDLKTGSGDVTIRITTPTDAGGTLVTEIPMRIE
ncbi:MAG: hypothetical protein QOJ98_2529 [Acidobacteriota bacterium]|nr:hypothetical protein [Acidobacteriota bacterium]